MSKVKLLISEVFKQGETDSGKNKKNGIALFLSVFLNESVKLNIDERTLVRYYDAYVAGIKKEMSIEPYKLDKLSQYIGYENFSDFSNTFTKKGEDANFTEIKVNVDGGEIINSKTSPEVNINITNINKPNISPVKEFITKNGLGILEITFVLLLVTGGVVFSNEKKEDDQVPIGLGFLSTGKSDLKKDYMYWDGDRYIATDNSYISPEFDVVAMDEKVFQHQRKITRKDTLTIANSLGKVWCSKWNNEVDFFTMDGINPDNGRELKLASDHMILKYAGKEQDSTQIEE